MSLSSSMRNRHQTDGDYRTSGTEEDTRAAVIPPSLFRIDDRAAGPVLRRNERERRESAGAFGYTESATRLEGAARRHGVQRRNCAFDGSQRTVALGLKVGHGLQETASIRMCGSVKDFMFAGQFDDASGIHYGDAVSNLRDHGEIVRDEKHGQAEPGAQVREQIEDLGLDGDIEGGGGFVGDEQLRTVHDGHRDHDTLAHAAGELMRIIAGAALGLGDGDVVHGLDGAFLGLAS